LTNQFDIKMKSKLTAMRDELKSVAATGDAASEVVELDQAKVGRLSRMDAMQAQAMSQASGRRREETLRLIESALGRIESGDFGLCADCEGPIASQRLEFDPAVERCIECAGKHEQAGVARR
jgi:DnaK suppressor protein